MYSDNWTIAANIFLVGNRAGAGLLKLIDRSRMLRGANDSMLGLDISAGTPSANYLWTSTMVELPKRFPNSAHSDYGRAHVQLTLSETERLIT